MLGLTSKKAQALLKKHGPNRIETSSRVSALKIFLSQFNNPLILILVFASIIAALAGEITDTLIITVVLFFNAFVGFYQEFKAEKSLEALQKMVPYRTRVYRDGRIIEIPASSLVPGDIIEIREGEKIPADASILESNELRVDESAMTGESVPVHKSEGLVLMGTVASSGRATARITATGMQTEFGRITRLTVETKDDPSPLQEELTNIGSWVSRGVIILSVLIFIVLTARNGTTNMLHYLIYAASLAVAAVPEGLPTTLTITLTRGARSLIREHSVVRKLNAVETLGSVSVICTDKTGTLTQNRMTITRAWTPNKGFHDLDSRNPLPNLPKQDPNFAALLHTGILCNDAHLQEKSNRLIIIGDPTEGCLLTLGRRYNLTKDSLLKTNPLLHTLDFDSERKRMTTLHSTKGRTHAHTKGSPEQVLAACSHILIKGKRIRLTAKHKKEIQKAEKTMAADALRILAFATRPVTSTEAKNPKINKIEKNLTFLGLAGMIDPPRTDVPAAVKTAHRAGIRIIMITGDSPITAAAIAKQIGLVQDSAYKTYTSQDLAKMKDKDLQEALQNPDFTPIFARTNPADKSRIVRLLKHLGERVAVTGDGVNDAPALKAADIGIAMGITGTDVAKEASDLVLLNDNFAAIVVAIREGRHIYANMKKFVHYSFSTNSGEVILITTAAILGLAQPLTPALILIVNLVTDILPALSLGVEPIEHNVMHEPPRKKTDRIFCLPFVRRFLMTGIIIGIGTLFTFYYYGNSTIWTSHEAPAQAMTATFIMLILFQLFNAFNSKSPTQTIFSRRLFNNPWLWAATLSGFFFILTLTLHPFTQDLLSITSLSFGSWEYFFLLGSTVFLAEETFKLIRRHHLKNSPKTTG